MDALWSAGRMAYAARSTGDEGAAREASRLAKKAPKMLPFREEAGSVSVPGGSGACSRSRMSPSARVSGVVCSTVTCRPFMGAPDPSRAEPPRRSAVMSE